MAVFNVLNYNAKDGFGMSLNIRRGNPNPLDNSSVWASLEAAQNYAKNDPVAYVGQVLTVVTDVVVGEETVKTATAYVIDNEAGDLKEVGSSPVGDESTITVSEDGTVSLYGIEGLALTREEEDGTTTNITYQPLFVNGKLTWVEPSSTTVEGLAAEIEGLKTRISELENTIGDAEEGLAKDINEAIDNIAAIEDKIGEVAEGKTVTEMIADAQTAATYDDTQVKADIKANADAIDAIEADYLKGADKTELSDAVVAEKTRAEGIEAGLRSDVDLIKGDYLTSSDKDDIQLQINTIMNNPDAEGAINSINEFTAYVNEHGTIAEGFRTDIDKNKEDIAANTQAIADQAAFDAATYETKADATAKLTEAKGYTDTAKSEIEKALDVLDASVEAITADYLKAADKTELQGNIDALTAVGAEKNVIATVDNAQFGLDSNRHLTLLDIAMSKVTGLADALAGKVEKVEGSRLLTADEATKLEKLVLGENGEVSVSGKVAAGNVEGLEDWITARAGTLKGLTENNFTDALVAKLNGIEEGAEVNDIVAITLGGGTTTLAIANRTVDIPVATTEALGVVKASSEVTVAANGTLSIGTISTDKLVQGEQTLILNGGAANV